MKITVIGGSGLIGSNLVHRLRRAGHDVLAASPKSGVDTITGAGLTAALASTEVVVDVANSPSFEDNAVLEFFRTSGRNLLAAGSAAGVRHHVALSVVGSHRLPDSGYMRAKLAQESLIKASGLPYTILRPPSSSSSSAASSARPPPVTWFTSRRRWCSRSPLTMSRPYSRRSPLRRPSTASSRWQARSRSRSTNRHASTWRREMTIDR